MKKLLIVILLLAAAAWFFGPKLLGGALKMGVEKGGSHVLDTETTLDSAEVNPIAGAVAMNDLAVAAPAGFKESPALAVGRIAVDVDLKSVTGEVIRVQEVEIREPEITLEVSTTGTNLGRLMDNLKAKTAGGPSQPAPKDPETAEAAGKKLNIETIRIVKPKVRLAQSLLASSSGEVVLETIELKNVGTENAPASVAQVLEQVIGAILGAAANANLGLPKDLDALLKGDAQKMVQQMQQQVDQLKSEVEKNVEDVKQNLEKEAEKLKDLGGMFGGKKEKE